MRLNFNAQILERMGEGVIVLNRQAQLVSHNAASKPWVALCMEKSAALKVLIEQADRGRVELPAKLGLFAKGEADGVPAADAWLCKNGLQEYAVFLVPQKPPPVDPGVAEKRYVSLLGDEVRKHMAELQSALQAGAQGMAHDSIASRCTTLNSLLKEISDLSLLMQRAHPFDDERIEMDLLLQDLLPRVQQSFENPFVFKPSGIKQGVLYGNAPWLTYALRTLLTGLGQSAPLGTEVVVSMHQMGGFLVLTANVASQFGMHPQQNASSAAQASPEASDDASDAARMVMALRIIELHAGTLKLNHLQGAECTEDAAALIESFTLTLPTGISSQQSKTVSCSECPVAQQAHIYATDMAILLAGK